MSYGIKDQNKNKHILTKIKLKYQGPKTCLRPRIIKELVTSNLTILLPFYN